jgi:hypothetical protein
MGNFNVGGFASGLTEGLKTGLTFGRALKQGGREDLEFEQKQEDRAKTKKKEARIEELNRDNMEIMFPKKDESASPASEGIRPPLQAAEGQPQLDLGDTGARPPLKGAPVQWTPEALTVGKPPDKTVKPLFGNLEKLNANFAELNTLGAPIDPKAFARYAQSASIIQQEGFANSTKALQSGDAQAWEAALNSSGTKGIKVINIKDGVADIHGMKIPTKIGILQMPDGSYRQADSQKDAFSLQEQSEVFKLIQENRKIAAEEKKADAAVIAANNKETAGGKPTEAARKQAELEAQNVPPAVARRIAYNTDITIRDVNGYTQAVVDQATDKPIGFLTKVDGKPVWQPTSEDQPVENMSRRDAETRARKEAADKAGLFSSDKSDFGGSREEWITQRTEEIYRQANGGGPAAGLTAPKNKPQPPKRSAKGASYTIPPASEREIGRVYDTPKGQLEWTGTGWLHAR